MLLWAVLLLAHRGLAQAALPLVIAHRGSPCALPEETLPGYRLAIESQADFIEMDVVRGPHHPLLSGASVPGADLCHAGEHAGWPAVAAA